MQLTHNPLHQGPEKHVQRAVRHQQAGSVRSCLSLPGEKCAFQLAWILQPQPAGSAETLLHSKRTC